MDVAGPGELEQPGGARPHRPEAPEGLDVAWVEQVRRAYDEVAAPLWRALVASSTSTEVADDAMADGFTQLLRRGPEVRDPVAWVWRASFRLAAGDLQRRQRAGERQLSGAGGEDATAVLVGRVDHLPDDAIDLVRALAQLSDQQRRCVALVDVAGHTAPSAAAILGTSAATVRVQLMRARRRLRALLADHDAEHDRDGDPDRDDHDRNGHRHQGRSGGKHGPTEPAPRPLVAPAPSTQEGDR